MSEQVISSCRPGRVMLWMLARTGSTAVTKCIGGIPEFEIWVEPLCFCSLAARMLEFEDQEELPHEYGGNEELYSRAAAKLDSRYGMRYPPERLSCADVKRSLEASTSKYLFVKDDSSAMYLTSEDRKPFIPEGFRHAFLIRDPTLVFASLRKTRFSLLSNSRHLLDDIISDERKFDLRVHDPVIPADAFFECHHTLWKYIRTHVDPDAIIIDNSDLLSNPSEMLPKFCEAMGLPYSDSLLEWDDGNESAKGWRWPSDDFVNDKHYMSNCMSTGRFQPPKEPPSRDQLSDDVIDLSNKANPFYQEMFENRLTA